MNRAVVFGWHNVLPTFFYQTGDHGVSGLECQLRWVQRTHDVVGLGEFINHVKSGGSRCRLALLTFDDGYVDNAEVVAPLLTQLGLPAVFFLVTGYLDGTLSPWWEVTPEGRPGATMMDWSAARSIVKAGFDVGSHTATHARLTELDDPLLAADLESPRERLMRELGVEPRAVAYPFGDTQSVDDRVAAAAATAGYEVGFTTRPGWWSPASDQLMIPRFVMEPGRSWRGLDRLPRILAGRARARFRGTRSSR